MQQSTIEIREDYYGYEPSNRRAVDWYLNFAHSDVFAFYGSRLMAQDEMLVAEHPALASLRETLVTLSLETARLENRQHAPTQEFIGLSTTLAMHQVRRHAI